MGITDDRRTDQDENTGADDCADAEASQVPSRQGLLEPVGGMIGVSKKLFDRFRAEKLLDHEVVRDGRRSDGRRVSCLTFHVPSSIAGPPACPGLRIKERYRVLGGAARGTEKSLKQLPMQAVSLK